MATPDLLDGCTGFDWDEANAEKNRVSHRVTFWEAEEVFFNEPLLLRPDEAHSRLERRFMALGSTDAGRLLFISFTVRRHLIRVISARDMTRREARTHAQVKA
ncbi:MAG: BrnT family toxin [Thermoanaerobaculia bacterium]|nr:BrnT family toxin [Thermoanaerobaculia bacterium]